MNQIEQNRLIWQVLVDFKNTNSKGKQLFAWHLASGLYLFFPVAVVAQSNIVPDSSLGDKNSIVNPNFDGLPIELITGGAQRGQNLFHSFQEFNISEGRSAYFANPEAVTNIFSRVTGNNVSNIFGTLGVNGTANLYFMNPNGIIFGQNSSLDVNGSFLGTTANSIQFGEQGFFSASEPDAPPLLTVNPSAFFFNQLNQGNIVNNSIAPAGVDPSGSFEALGLRVADGKSLSLLGGDITVDSGDIIAFGGTINLASVADTGAVNLDIDEDNFSFSFSELSRGNISIVNNAGLLALGNGGGDINLTANDISIDNNSFVETGIASDLGSPTTQAGNITFDANGDITLDNNSFILNRVRTTSTGNSGDILFNANNLTINSGSQLASLVFGQGDTGNIEINVEEFISMDTNESGIFTGIFAEIGELGIGDAGNIAIKVDTLNLDNGARIDTISFGQGNSGNIEIQANLANLANRSFVSTETNANTVGDAGNINFDINSLNLTGNSNLNSSSFGQGDSGLIDIIAISSINLDSSGIFSEISSDAIGEGSEIRLDSNEINLSNGSSIGARTFGQGNSGNISLNATDIIEISGENTRVATDIGFTVIGNGIKGGDITINTEQLSVTDKAQISASTFGQGNSGNINIQADSVNLGNASLISTEKVTNSVGNAGNINLETGSISINNTTISANSFGQGDAGEIKIQADRDISLISSLIRSNINPDAKGNVGSIILEADSIFSSDNTQLQAGIFSRGQGEKGKISLKVDGLVIFDSSSIFADVQAETSGDSSDIDIQASSITLTNRSVINTENGGSGDAGDINLATKFLTVSNGSKLSTNTFGEGNAGNISLDAAQTIEIRGENTRVQANVVSDAGNIRGGNLIIDTKKLLVVDGAQVSVSTFGQGNAGNLVVNATESVELKGEDNNGTQFPGGLFAQVDVAGEGQGGDLIINTSKLSISDGSKVQVATFGKGDAGELVIRANEIDIFNTPQFSDFTTGIFGSVAVERFGRDDPPEGNGGNVSIQTDFLRVIDGGKISVTTQGIGDGGFLEIIAEESIEIRGVDPEPSDGVSFIGGSVEKEAIGSGGDVSIKTQNLSISDRGEISVSTLGTGVGGDINITANSLNLDGEAIINAETFTTDGGNIDLQITDLLTLNNQSKISATAGIAEAGGDGGNVTIDTEFLVAFPESNSDITANAFAGDGGRIDLTAESIFGIEARLATPENTTNDIDASSQFGLDGDVSIETPDVEPARGLDNLPSNLVDASRLITRNCLATADEEKLNEFVITGKGGFPANPENIISNDATLSAEWLTLPETDKPFVVLTEPKNSSSKAVKEIVEATGWAFNEQGKLLLVADTPQSEFKIPWSPNHSCPDLS